MGIIKKVRGISIIDEEKVNNLLDELQAALIEAEVNIDITLAMLEHVREQALKDIIAPGVS